MKGTINTGSHGKKTGGDMGYSCDTTKINARNLRRMMKKFPNDKKIQELLSNELKKYEIEDDN